MHPGPELGHLQLLGAPIFPNNPCQRSPLSLPQATHIYCPTASEHQGSQSCSQGVSSEAVLGKGPPQLTWSWQQSAAFQPWQEALHRVAQGNG